MAWQIAITLAAIGALVLYHAFAATAKPDDEAGAAQKRDPWARILVAGAVLAALLALGVVIVPAVEGNDEAASTTPSTTTTLPTTTTTPPTTGTSPTTTPTTEPTTTTAPTTGSTTL